MKTSIAILICVGLLITAGFHADGGVSAADEVALTADQTTALTASDQLQSLSWLQGHWKGDFGGGRYETVYSSADAGTIVGASKDISNGKTRTVDFERMYVKGGDVILTPYPSGRQSVDFKMIDCDKKNRRVVFANPDHDFPQKFTYEAHGKDRLLIHLEGEGGNGPMKMTLELERHL